MISDTDDVKHDVNLMIFQKKSKILANNFYLDEAWQTYQGSMAF